MNTRILCFVLLLSSCIAVSQEFNAMDADGKRHGQWKKTYENSTQVRYEGTFDHGKEVGVFKFYKPTSGKQPTAIKRFSKTSNTVQVQYFTARGAVISEGTMIGKERVGVWKYYHNGSKKVMMTEMYTAGKLDGEQLTYFKNGQLTEKTTYIAGKREGKRILYSDKGTIIKEYSYVNDQLHGPTKFFDTQGVLKIEGNYKKNRKDGVWNYYEAGKLKEQKLFPLQKKR